VNDQGITIPVLSDPNLAVSRAYSANNYGMMATAAMGITFVLVGPDGNTSGAPITAVSPLYHVCACSNLLADLKTGTQEK